MLGLEHPRAWLALWVAQALLTEIELAVHENSQIPLSMGLFSSLSFPILYM